TREGPLVRADLCVEAIRLGRLVRTLMAPRPSSDTTALLALMLLHDSRRDARLNDAGDLVLLEDQDRSSWNQEQIAKRCRSSRSRFVVAQVRLRFRPQLPPFIARLRAPKTRIGPRSSVSTTLSNVSSLLRLYR